MKFRSMLTRRQAVRTLLGAAAVAATVASGLAHGAPAAPAEKAAAAKSAWRHAHPADAVLHWNGVAEQALTPAQGTNPMAHSRVLAILHASVHDALNAIDRRYAPYTDGLPAAPGADPDAAVAAAAREVLVRLVPEQAALVEAAFQQALARLADGAARGAGLAVGQAAAGATLARRDGDGSADAAIPYLPGTAPGEYRFTPPFDFAAQPGWGRVRPFVVDLADHALPGPLALESRAYARDVAEVAAIGRVDSATRSAEQAEIASFWYEDSTLGWNRIAHAALRQRRVDAWDAARAFALVHFAMADGFIAGFAEKYRHRFWRPETAIRAAAGDGNPLTAADPAWQPLLVTPPVPDYPSTHTVLGWAAAEVLTAVLGERGRFATTSLTLPGVTRRFRGFADAADENARSRLYAGIHFGHAVRDGRRQGRGIGRAVARALPRVR